MSRSRSRPSLLALAVLALAAQPARAAAHLEVSGEVVGRAPRLEVRIRVANRGDAATGALEVTGELLGERRVARLVRGVAPGGQAAVILDFAPNPARAGVHALTLLLEHPVAGAPDAAGNPPVASRQAFLLLALGAQPGPAVTIAPGTATLDVEGELPIKLESADGAAHRVRVRAVTARGLLALEPPAPVEVPATGEVTTSLPLVRAGAPRGTRHGVLVVAEALDGVLARTSVVTAEVAVAPDPSLLLRVRREVFLLALALLLAAVVLEARRRVRVPPGPRT